ncbi:MAG: polymer-forming cytoskeletal protein [Deltaproteobacteria bacterium]|nr:MAG: polymer-forming cytoskeletal protein [Deltaproteobacteria bacterium]
MCATGRPGKTTPDCVRFAGVNPMVIPAGGRIQGRVDAPGDVAIAGRVDGEVYAEGTVTVSAGATCRATVRARQIRIYGELIGNATGAERIDVGDGARVVGDLRAPAIEIHAGAVVDGRADRPPETAEVGPRRIPRMPRPRGPVRVRIASACPPPPKPSSKPQP